MNFLGQAEDKCSVLVKTDCTGYWTGHHWVTLKLLQKFQLYALS